MSRFSANLGFLWKELSLPDAIRAARQHRFAAVEVHWPYECDTETVRDVLLETGLPLLGLNTRAGNVDTGSFGLSALPGEEKAARKAIDEAVDFAEAVGAGNIHVMAGNAEGIFAHNTFIANLVYAVERASEKRITILIEPLNAIDVPGYFLSSTYQAAEIIADIDAPNLKLMFDCYHSGKSGEDVPSRLQELAPMIGHVQFAAVADRGAPLPSDPWLQEIMDTLESIGWQQPVGAEYRPGGPTENTLGWMDAYLP